MVEPLVVTATGPVRVEPGGSVRLNAVPMESVITWTLEDVWVLLLEFERAVFSANEITGDGTDGVDALLDAKDIVESESARFGMKDIAGEDP